MSRTVRSLDYTLINPKPNTPSPFWSRSRGRNRLDQLFISKYLRTGRYIWIWRLGLKLQIWTPDLQKHTSHTFSDPCPLSFPSDSHSSWADLFFLSLWKDVFTHLQSCCFPCLSLKILPLFFLSSQNRALFYKETDNKTKYGKRKFYVFNFLGIS